MTTRKSLVISTAIAVVLGGSLLVAPALSSAGDDSHGGSDEGIVAETNIAPVDDENVATSDTAPTDPGDAYIDTDSGRVADAGGEGVSEPAAAPQQDFGDPNFVSPPDEGDPNANGQDEPPAVGG